jgi:hypothetical protein
MTDITPETIRDRAMQRFNELAPAKYDQGQAEHGGILIERDLVSDMEREVIDFWFYLQALRQRMEQ